MVLASAWGLGRAAWRGRPPAETLALACGVPLLSLACFLLLAGHAAYREAFAAVLAAGILLLWRYRPARPALPRVGWLELPIAVFGLLYLLHALAPEIQPDGTTYHLGLPKVWLRDHGFPAQIGFYEIMPLGMEVVYAAAMSLGGNPKLLSLAFLFAAVPLIRRLGERVEVPPDAARLASVLYFCAPVAGVSGTSSYTDTALVFFTLAALDLLLRWERERRWPLLAAAGLAAGFCYAVKFSGAIIVVPVVGLALWRRKWTAAAVACGAALLSMAPWMARAWYETGNPIAPLGNALFPNESFHIQTELNLARFLREFNGVQGSEIPWALTGGGEKLQGTFGLLFLLAPLALLALRRKSGRTVLALALLLAVPWLGNKGARFLMPASAPLALALASVAPAPVLLPAALLHGLLSWPDVQELYAGRYAWRLKETPWRVALGLEPQSEYLRRTFWEYRVVEKFRPHLRPGDAVLDTYGLPYYYLDTLPVGSLPTRRVDNLVEAIDFAGAASADPYAALSAAFPPAFVRRVRVRGAASIHEIQLLRDGGRLAPSAGWTLESWPNAADGPLAVDGNMATAWKPWEPWREGMYLDVVCGRPERADGVRVVFNRKERSPAIEVYVQGMSRDWTRVASGLPDEAFPALSPPRSATQALKRDGIRYLVIHSHAEGHGIAGKKMDADPAGWNLERVESVDNVHLFRVK